MLDFPRYFFKLFLLLPGKNRKQKRKKEKPRVLITAKEIDSVALCHYIRLVFRVKRSYSLFSVLTASMSGVVVQMKLSLLLQLCTYLIKL